MKNYRKAIFFTLIVLAYINSTAQIRKFPCSRYPDSTKIIQALANKPVGVYPKDICLRCNVTDTIKKDYCIY